MKQTLKQTLAAILAATLMTAVFSTGAAAAEQGVHRLQKQRLHPWGHALYDPGKKVFQGCKTLGGGLFQIR